MLRAAVSPDRTRLAASFGGAEPVEVHAMWLRDACGCEQCRRPTTNERLLDSSSVEADLTIIDAATDDVTESGTDARQTLQLVMSDGHTVTLDADWLREHVQPTQRTRVAGAHRLWPTPVLDSLDRFERSDLDRPDGLVAWIDAIWRDGAAVVTGVHPSDSGLRAVAALVGDVRATNYGVTWEIAATVEPVSAVDSERHLRVHTDLPYRTEAPGLQLLLAVVTDVDGGASTLVDGYAAAERLRHDAPDAWELLTNVDFTHPYVRADVEIHGTGPLIRLRRDGSYHEIRRAPDLRGVPIVSADDTPSLYAALRAWSELLDDPARTVTISLAPGELLAFHNHRLLHGRTAFELGASGDRRLVGCYLDVDDLHSRRAVAARGLAVDSAAREA